MNQRIKAVFTGTVAFALAGSMLTGCASTDGSAEGSEIGITSTEIHLGATAALSGPAASYSNYTKGVEAYFKHINAEGGINGREVKYTIVDDGYDPSKTVPLTQRLVDQEKVFAIVGALGTPTQAAVYKRLNSQKVPDVLIGSGSSAFVDPVLPYVTMLFPSYVTENAILGEHLKKAYPGKKLGLLYQNDDAGADAVKAYTQVFGDALVAKEGYETTDPTVSPQMNNLRSSGAELVAVMGSPKWVALALKDARSKGWDAPFVANGSAVDATTIDLAEGAADGLVTAKAFRPDGDTSDAAVKKAVDLVKKYAPNLEIDDMTLRGVSTGMITAEALKSAGKDLTREGFIEALDKTSLDEGPWYGTAKLTADQHAAVGCLQLMKIEGDKQIPLGDVVCP